MPNVRCFVRPRFIYRDHDDDIEVKKKYLFCFTACTCIINHTIGAFFISNFKNQCDVSGSMKMAAH